MIPLYSRRSWLLALISPIEVIASRSQQTLCSGIIAGAERSVQSVSQPRQPEYGLHGLPCPPPTSLGFYRLVRRAMIEPCPSATSRRRRYARALSSASVDAAAASACKLGTFAGPAQKFPLQASLCRKSSRRR
jgi:hypothetical protein